MGGKENKRIVKIYTFWDVEKNVWLGRVQIIFHM
jgi:hypothetical protein